MRFFLLLNLIIISASYAENKLSISKTVEQIIIDSKSKDCIVRKKSAMILGKYNSQIAMKALVNCLSDENDMVRNAALVSIMEKNYIPQYAKENIFYLLVDSNVHTRRLASSSLMKLYIPQINNRPNLCKIIKMALSDKDDIVRENMISNINYINFNIPNNILENALKDSNDNIKIVALNKILNYRNKKILLDTMIELSKSKNIIIKKTLLSSMRFLTKTNKFEEVIQTLIKDDDIGIKAEAISLALSKQILIDFETIKGILLSKQIEENLGVKIISYITIRKDNLIFFQNLLKDERVKYRSIVLSKIINSRYRKEIDIWSFLNDESIEVRKVASYAILKYNSKKNIDDLFDFINSPYSDVREFLVIYATKQEQSVCESLLLELLLDEDENVRLLVLSRIYNKQIKDWLNIIILALDEDSELICNLVVKILSKHFKVATYAEKISIEKAFNIFLDNPAKSPYLKTKIQTILLLKNK